MNSSNVTLLVAAARGLAKDIKDGEVKPGRGHLFLKGFTPCCVVGHLQSRVPCGKLGMATPFRPLASFLEARDDNEIFLQRMVKDLMLQNDNYLRTPESLAEALNEFAAEVEAM